ncbi:hemolytic protein HlpA [Cytophagales bacterium WSM2-2]|nr:hemolytic protein HlpA [Cytophagales bacterium WSM2-2]
MNIQETAKPLTTPVLLLIFNRPETTRKVLDAIRKVKPTKLYIAADGPRSHIKEDVRKCKEAREVVSQIDWDCTVTRLFRDENLGCGKGPSSAMTWFFDQEEEGIILEDDCLPSSSFFSFCAELLERYRHDTRIMEIGGTNFESKKNRGSDYSYFFSNMIYIWGWATWRRAWKLYDYEMGHYNEITRKQYLDGHFDFAYEVEHFNYIFEKMHTGDERTSRKTVWDYQWQFICKINSGLIIVPEKNLVTNLGFGADATNTKNPIGAGHDLKMEELDFPLKHPEFIMVNKKRDHRYFNEICSSRVYRMKSSIKQYIPKPVFESLKYFFKSAIRLLSSGRVERIVSPHTHMLRNQQ